MASILVTGASGFLGSTLIPGLLHSGHRVTGIARHQGRFLQEETLRHKNFRFITCDISKNFNSLLSGIPVDIVYHLASRQPSKKGIPYADFYAGNVETTRSVIALCARKSVRTVIYVSTVALYGKTQAGKHLNEKTPINPDNYYTLTKYIAEKLLEIELEHSSSSLYIIRLPSLFGKNHLGGIVYNYFTLINSGRDLTVFNDGKTLRNIFYVDDAVRVLQKIIVLQKYLKKNELFVLGSSNSIRTFILAQAIKKLIGSASKISRVKKNIASNFDTLIDIGKAKRKLHFNPLTIRQGLAAYVKEMSNGF